MISKDKERVTITLDRGLLRKIKRRVAQHGLTASKYMQWKMDIACFEGDDQSKEV